MFAQISSKNYFSSSSSFINTVLQFFVAYLIEDPVEYIVKIDRTKKYAPILKSSIEQIETGNRLFLMKDKAAVEQAIESGAERCTDETEFKKLIQ